MNNRIVQFVICLVHTYTEYNNAIITIDRYSKIYYPCFIIIIIIIFFFIIYLRVS